MDFRVVDLSGAQTEDVEDQLAAFDASHFGEPPRGEVNIGIEVGGKLIAGAIAEMTAFRILYVSVVFVDEVYRRHGIGRRLMAEVEKRGRALGADLIRLDTFDWQGVEFTAVSATRRSANTPAVTALLGTLLSQAPWVSTPVAPALDSISRHSADVTALRLGERSAGSDGAQNPQDTKETSLVEALEQAPVVEALETTMTGAAALTTARLVLREMTDGDLVALRAIMQDPITMTAYEGSFSDDEVEAWLEKQRTNYREFGHGLWAVTLRDPGSPPGAGPMIGQCGITWQDIDGQRVLEVGYLFNRAYWHRGYATEAARACRDWAFTVLGAEEVFAQVRDTNLASMNVAIRLGMTIKSRFTKHYRGVEMPHYAFSVHRPSIVLSGDPTS